MNNTITAILHGKDRIITLWPHPTNGDYQELHGIAIGAAREVENTGLRLNRIVNDRRLSEEAKKEDRKEAGLDSLKRLAQMAARLELIRKQHTERANRLAAVAPYASGDAATPLIDMEIARKLDAMKDSTARVVLLISGEQPRLTEAALRLPPFLSGLSAAEYRRISAAAIERVHPTESRTVAELAEALEHAEEAVGRSFKLIAEGTGAELIAQIASAGDYAAQLVKNVHPVALEMMQGRLAGDAA